MGVIQSKVHRFPNKCIVETAVSKDRQQNVPIDQKFRQEWELSADNPSLDQTLDLSGTLNRWQGKWREGTLATGCSVTQSYTTRDKNYGIATVSRSQLSTPGQMAYIYTKSVPQGESEASKTVLSYDILRSDHPDMEKALAAAAPPPPPPPTSTDEAPQSNTMAVVAIVGGTLFLVLALVVLIVVLAKRPKK